MVPLGSPLCYFLGKKKDSSAKTQPPWGIHNLSTAKKQGDMLAISGRTEIFTAWGNTALLKPYSPPWVYLELKPGGPDISVSWGKDTPNQLEWDRERRGIQRENRNKCFLKAFLTKFLLFRVEQTDLGIMTKGVSLVPDRAGSFCYLTVPLGFSNFQTLFYSKLPLLIGTYVSAPRVLDIFGNFF